MHFSALLGPCLPQKAVVTILLLRAHLCRRLDPGEGEQLPFVIHSTKNEECTVNVPWLGLDPLLTVVSLDTDTDLHTERKV